MYMIWLCMYTHVNTIIHMNTSTCSWVTISKSSFDDQIHTLDSSITYASKVHMLTKHNHIDIWKWRVDISKSRIPQFNPMSFWFSEHVLIAKSSLRFKSPWIFWLHSTDFFWLVKKKSSITKSPPKRGRQPGGPALSASPLFSHSAQGSCTQSLKQNQVDP